jgi:hypothetical protein
MNVMVKSAEAIWSEGGLALTQFRFDTPQLAAGSFILVFGISPGFSF